MKPTMRLVTESNRCTHGRERKRNDRNISKCLTFNRAHMHTNICVKLRPLTPDRINGAHTRKQKQRGTDSYDMRWYNHDDYVRSFYFRPIFTISTNNKTHSTVTVMPMLLLLCSCIQYHLLRSNTGHTKRGSICLQVANGLRSISLWWIQVFSEGFHFRAKDVAFSRLSLTHDNHLSLFRLPQIGPNLQNWSKHFQKLIN